MGKSDYNVDRRKYEVGDRLKYRNQKGEVAEHVLYAVRYQEDVDGIRHSYEYIMDIEDQVPETKEPLYCIVNSTEILEKLPA